jgi:hypothetical protein
MWGYERIQFLGIEIELALRDEAWGDYQFVVVDLRSCTMINWEDFLQVLEQSMRSAPLEHLNWVP